VEFLLKPEEPIGSSRKKSAKSSTEIQNAHVCNKVSDWVAVGYDAEWFPGIVMAHNAREHCMTVRFMHPTGGARVGNRFRFPAADDVDVIDDRKILCSLSAPISMNDTRMTHCFTDTDFLTASNKFANEL
jgi:hypothetical protein